MRTVITREQSTLPGTCTVQLYCTTAAWQCITKSQPRTGHTREPDPTHNELKHSATPTRERTRQGNHRLRELHRPLRQRLGW